MQLSKNCRSFNATGKIFVKTGVPSRSSHFQITFQPAFAKATADSLQFSASLLAKAGGRGRIRTSDPALIKRML